MMLKRQGYWRRATRRLCPLGLLLSLAAVFSAGLAASEVYTWTDESGTVHYSDTPRQDGRLLRWIGRCERTERLLQGLGIQYELIAPSAGSLPQIWIDGQAIGGYPELAALQSQGALQNLRHG